MAAREFHSAFSAAEVANTSISDWARIGQLDFVARAGVDYVVFWSFEGTKATVTNSSFLFRLTAGAVVVEEGQVRPRTTSDYPLLSGFFRLRGEGLSASVAIEIINAQGAYPALGRNASLVALALSDGDIYVESLPRVETTSSAFAPLVEVIRNAPADDYLLLGISFTDNNNTTAPTYAGFNLNGEASATYMVGHGNLADVRPLWGLWRRSLATDGPLNLQWSGRSHVNGAICGWRSNRALALKLGGFVASNYSEEITNPTGAEEAFIDALSLGARVSSNPHLLLTAFQTASPANSVLHAVRVTENAAEIGRGTQRTYASSASRAAHQGLISLREGQGEGQKVWRLERASDGVTPITLVIGSSMALLDLGSSRDAVAADRGALIALGAEAHLKLARRLPGARTQFATAGLDASLGRGFGLRSAAALFRFQGSEGRLRRGVRLDASSQQCQIAGFQVGLSRQGSGRRISCAALDVWSTGRSSSMRAARRRQVAAVHFEWARLDIVLRRSLISRAADGAFTIDGTKFDWSQVRVMKPRSFHLDYAFAPARLAYSGQKFWQASAPTAELWRSPQTNDARWIAPPPVSETWN